MHPQTKQAPPSYFFTKPLSCNFCRKSKLKCDRKNPCGACVSRKIEAQCYQEEPNISTHNRLIDNSQSEKASSSSRQSPYDPPPIDVEALNSVTAALRQHQYTLESLSTIICGKQSSQPLSWLDEVVESLPSAGDCDYLLDYYYGEVRCDTPL